MKEKSGETCQEECEGAADMDGRREEAGVDSMPI
jgi:hypothetical protein